MCGICGRLNFDSADLVSSRLIEKMTDALAHRGPDGSGQFVSGPLGLGHTRLSIIDLSTGEQPLANEDGSIQVVFNGEIYNYRTLRDSLLRSGHRFKSTSDTEVLVHAYEEWGERFIERLEGMFAFALWDSSCRRLLLGRDRIGIKPLYVSRTNRGIVFASEIKAVLLNSDVGRDIDWSSVARFCRLNYLGGSSTLFRGIEKLAPASYMKIEGGRVDVVRYWSLEFSERDSLDFAEARAELESLLAEVVDSHLISDVPIGVLLSGGLDSTGILRFAAASAPGRLRTFTIGFDRAAVSDERPYARIAAQAFGTEHHEVLVDAAQFRDSIPLYVRHMEEPVCEPPAIALYHVTALARRTGVKVLLSGEGGDEAFGGYDTYRRVMLLERAKAALGPLSGALGLGLSVVGSLGSERAARYAPLATLPLSAYYEGRTSVPPRAEAEGLSSVWREGIRHSVKDAEAGRWLSTPPGLSPLNHMLSVDTRTWLPDDLLLKADKMTMAASTELRVPFLDRRVLEFAASLPTGYKVDGRTTKKILREVLKQGIPDAILRRKKVGFTVPYDRWLAGELRPYAIETLLASTSPLHDFADVRDVRRLVAKPEAAAKTVFSLLVLDQWFREFTADAVAA